MQENITQDMNRTIYLSVCDKTVTAEVGCDYLMPDYQPEIRRLLRVRATVLPPATYVGAGKAEFAGAVRYDVLYAGNDGALYSASVSENYELSAPLATDADVDYSDELIAYCDPTAELLTGRVTAPRKLSLRCRLRGQIRAFGRRALGEQLVGEGAEGAIQRLEGEVSCLRLVPRATEPFTVSEELAADFGESVRVVSGDASAVIRETSVMGDGVGCRGEVFLRLLVGRDGEDTPPVAVSRRIPFGVTVASDGFTLASVCRATACCTEVSVTVAEDGRILADVSGSVSAEGHEAMGAHYTKDLYSTEQLTRAVFADYSFPATGQCIAGNFTQSLYEPLSAFGLAPDCEVIDADATASVEGVTFERGRFVVTGDTRLGLITREGGEYAAHDLTTPFRFETEGAGGCGAFRSAEVVPLSVRARAEGGRLAVECEMAVSAHLCGEGRVTTLTRAELGEAVSHPRETVIAFPERGESLWSVAKRYHVPAGTLARNNAVAVSISTPLPTTAPIVVNE